MIMSSEPTLQCQYFSVQKISDIYSAVLDRAIEADVFFPNNFPRGKPIPFLLLNDGQDNRSVRLPETLDNLCSQNEIKPFAVISVYAGERMQEYGVAAKPDYLKRGSFARDYSRFILEELLPFVKYLYRIDLQSGENAIAGYSLGGLSAFDIGWNHPELFSKIGVFSGSFWWRKKALAENYKDSRDRIVHSRVRHSAYKAGLKFWFQTGTLDESHDRNGNGVIDSIDDTLDLISELIKKGYDRSDDIHYLEIKDGRHNQETWAQAMPEFLKWAFGKIDN
jgi:enterochelin esterase-like enzyme